MIDVTGSRAIVIGGAGTIGSAVGEAFAAAGADVVLADLDLSRARDVARRLRGSGHAALRVDVTDVESVQRLAEEAWRGGPVDAVVYAAGVTFTADVVAMDWGEYHRLMGVNLHGACYTAQAIAGHMLRNGVSGSFVFISSVAGKRGEAGASAYCISKFGLLGLVESFAAEVAAQGIRANAVCPGNVDSPMLDAVSQQIAAREGRSQEAVMQDLVNAAATGRLVDPREVASTCLWLCSPLASGITGESVNVDGGG